MTIKLLRGDCRSVLKTLPDASVHCCITSPPYWGLRSYLPASHPDKPREIGSEPTVGEWVSVMVEVFREVRRVLRDDGTLWLNLGDSYTSSGGGSQGTSGQRSDSRFTMQRDAVARAAQRTPAHGLKPKDLIGQPWRVAFALQADGWWLRQEIIWCLSGGAWVYARTLKGDMPVMVKDLVRLDPRTVKLWNGEKWTQVLGWGPSNDTSERLELVLRSGERIGCTGQHLWPTQRGNVAARDLRLGDVVQTCRLPQSEGAARPEYLTNDLLWLVGLYLAEGSRSKGSALQLALNADEAPWLPRIEAAARHLGGTATHTRNGNTLNVRLFGRVLHAAIDTYIGGKTAVDKHLKVAVWRLPSEALSALVQGYLDGDGHDDAGNGRWRLGFCRNYALERDLRTLAARLGATLTLKPGTATYQGGEAPTFRGEWRWERTGHHNEKDRGEVIEIRASRARKFWDIAVEDEPHLFALASGVLTHNCKKNPMPESVRDRFTKSHEHVFLLSKSATYYFDFDAVQEEASEGTHARLPGNRSHKHTAAYEAGDEKARTKAGLVAYAERQRAKCKLPHNSAASRKERANEASKSAPTELHNGMRAPTPKLAEVGSGTKNNASFDDAMAVMPQTRNPRSVRWLASEPFRGAHFATYPPELIRPFVLAGCPPGGTVLDPFGGSGTTGLVCDQEGRGAILIDLDERNMPMARERITADAPLFTQIEAAA